MPKLDILTPMELLGDPRYSIRLEWCGYAEPRWVVRFCGDWVGQRFLFLGAKELMKRHNAERLKL